VIALLLGKYDQETSVYVVDMDLEDQEPLEELDLLQAALRGMQGLPNDAWDIAQACRNMEVDGNRRRIVKDRALRLHLLVMAHCGLAGHRRIEATYSRLKDGFIWPTMKEDCRSFVQKCVHCLYAQDFRRSVSLGEALHAEEPNQLVYMDFLYIEPKGYVLVVKDDFSHYTELVPVEHADHLAVASTLLDWTSRFGLPKGICTDQGPHFRNKVLEEMSRLLGFKQAFTPAYFARSNGTIEIVNRLILTALRSLISEYRLMDWRQLITTVQATLNLTATPLLKGMAPTEVFTSRKPRTPGLDLILDEGWKLKELTGTML